MSAHADQDALPPPDAGPRGGPTPGAGRAPGLLARAACAGLVVAVSALLASGPLWDRDWGWHLATFERMVAERRLPWDDRFSYTAERPYEPVHVAFQLALGGLHRAFGLDGVALLRALGAAAIGLALHAALRGRGLPPLGAAALASCCQAAGAYRLVERPHLATTLGLVLLLDALTRARGGGSARRVVPLLALWANAHPGVVWGVGVAWGFVLVEVAAEALRRRRPGLLPGPGAAGGAVPRLAGWVALGTAATCLNPLGPDLYRYLLAHRDLQEAVQIVELAPAHRSPPIVWLAAGTLLLGGLLAARARGALAREPGLAATTAGLTLLGLGVGRELPLAVNALAFALAPTLARAARARGRAVLALTCALLVVPAALGVAREVRTGLAAGRWPGGAHPGVHPARACDWILAHRPAGPLYNTNACGGYLVYRLTPAGYRVHSDGRMPLFPAALAEARDFARLVARHAPELLVLDWAHPLEHAPPPELSPGFAADWALVHVSRGAKVYVRRAGPNADLARAHGYRHLRYVGRYWPGRVRAGPHGPFTPVPAPQDDEGAAALAAEVARARADDPGNPYLPPER